MLTDGQIQTMFRYCKDVDQQVTICSQLTGKSEAEICEIVGIDPESKSRRKHGERTKYIKWTSEEVENLCKAYKCGLGYKKISKMLDRPKSSVINKIYELKSKGILKDE